MEKYGAKIVKPEEASVFKEELEKSYYEDYQELKKENEKLKEDDRIWLKQNSRLVSRIDKAVKYIEEHSIIENNEITTGFEKSSLNKLYRILRGEK